MNLQIIILAAGQGKRMYSQLPKVLHSLAGKPMLERVIDTAKRLEPKQIHVIYGHEGARIQEAMQGQPVHWVQQVQQLGTGHAVMQALPYLEQEDWVLVLSADVPLIQMETLEALIQCATSQDASLALLLATLDNPFGLGRILRDEAGKILAIVEEKDANEKERAIQEIYSGICCAKASDLMSWLPQLQNNNQQEEYYLTDLIALAVRDQKTIAALNISDFAQIQGVNNRLQLQQLERLWQIREAERLLLAGVGIADAARMDVRGELECGQDVFIDVGCVFEGKVILEDGASIGAYCVLRNTTVGKNTTIYSHSVLDGVILKEACAIGPFARLRPGTQLDAHCKIGNFVETKSAVFGEGSKASHLSYLGDATLGKNVNVGAGTITCNYDGANKHQTLIEDGAFIGSDTQLVAPVTVGANATIGAGSTIRKNVPAGELTLSESKQKTIVGWKRPVKK